MHSQRANSNPHTDCAQPTHAINSHNTADAPGKIRDQTRIQLRRLLTMNQQKEKFGGIFFFISLIFLREKFRVKNLAEKFFEKIYYQIAKFGN